MMMIAKLSFWQRFLAFIGITPREPKPKPKRKVEVGRTFVCVKLNDGTTHEFNFTGRYVGPAWGSDFIYDSDDIFAKWRARAGQNGMASVGSGKYVPLCNVKEITSVREDLQVETDVPSPRR